MYPYVYLKLKQDRQVVKSGWRYFLILQELICNDETLRNTTNCSTKYCECVHVLKVGLGDTVELVLIDEGYTYSANHPMHLHGNYFRVIGMDKVSTYKNI